MSRIHHTQAQKAEKMGVHLEESSQFIKAIWPMRNIAIFGVDARWAIEQMEATQRLVKYAEEHGSELSVRPSVASPTQVHLIIDGESTQIIQAPIMWWQNKEKIEFAEQTEPMVRIKVVGPAGEKLDEAIEDADESKVEEAGGEEKPAARSVVKSKYRAIYAEAGHPTNCGDELAEKLNNLIANKGGTNIELLDALAQSNGVNLEKYNRTSNGWQGRLRMTFRNILAKKLRENGGVLKLPEGWPEGPELRMSQEWMAK